MRKANPNELDYRKSKRWKVEVFTWKKKPGRISVSRKGWEEPHNPEKCFLCILKRLRDESVAPSLEAETAGVSSR